MFWKLWWVVVVEETIKKKTNKNKPQKNNETNQKHNSVCMSTCSSFRKDKEKLKFPPEPMLQGENPNKVR